VREKDGKEGRNAVVQAILISMGCSRGSHGGGASNIALRDVRDCNVFFKPMTSPWENSSTVLVTTDSTVVLRRPKHVTLPSSILATGRSIFPTSLKTAVRSHDASLSTVPANLVLDLELLSPTVM
jgi:hypothetical protein